MTDNSELDFLKQYSTTQLESAMALFKLRARNEGVSLPGLEQRFPGFGRLVGYAVTCTFSTDPDDARGRRENFDYWNYLGHVAGPKVVIAAGRFNSPHAMAADRDGNLYIVEWMIGGRMTKLKRLHGASRDESS